jgi:hypothetical protein
VAEFYEFYHYARASLQEQKILEEEDKSRSQELERVEVRVEMESQSGDFTGNTLIKVHGCS